MAIGDGQSAPARGQRGRAWDFMRRSPAQLWQKLGTDSGETDYGLELHAATPEPT
jgi:hypothetical protein